MEEKRSRELEVKAVKELLVKVDALAAKVAEADVRSERIEGLLAKMLADAGKAPKKRD